MKEKLLYAHCPACGHLLLKGIEVKKAELHCSKCNKITEVKIQEGYIELHNIQMDRLVYA